MLSRASSTLPWQLRRRTLTPPGNESTSTYSRLDFTVDISILAGFTFATLVSDMPSIHLIERENFFFSYRRLSDGMGERILGDIRNASPRLDRRSHLFP